MGVRQVLVSRFPFDFRAAEPAGPFHVVIPHRSPAATEAALDYAATLADGLDARIRLLDIHVVPYGIPLDEPNISPKHLERRLSKLAERSTLPVAAEVIYARDWEQGLRRSITPHSVVLLAGPGAWWKTSEKRLASRLRKAGHQIVWVDHS